MNERATRACAALSLSVALAASGCSDSVEENACGLELNAKVDALVATSASLEARATALQSDVDTACENIVLGLDGTLPPAGDDPAAYTEAVCQAAAEAISTAVAGGIAVTVEFAPPICTIDADAQIACESDCYVDATCDPGTVETRCEPGELSVVCDGTCEVNAYCESTATVEAMCNGSCDGLCAGTCNDAPIDGVATCEGTCVGSCQGSCLVTASGGIDCGADARCRGGCDGTATLPECRTTLEPPACDVDADCQAACEAQGSFNATCTEAEVVVTATGTGASTLASVLETNLPTLIGVGESLALLAGDANAFVTSANAVLTEVSGIPACAAVKAGQIAAAIEAAAAAAAAIEVTVDVSVCVSASTDGSAPPCGA